jgi:hypothetical protein
MDYHTVDRVRSFIVNNNIDIDIKLKNQADVMHLKLEKELDIRNYIKSVAHIDDYKTILKSVKILNDKMSAAQNLGVDLDLGVIAEINRCTSRLISERNLRHEMEMTNVSKVEHDNVNLLKNLIERAHEHGVADSYKQDAEKLQHKMNGNIRAREILQMMLDYPEREYPVIEVVDPKKKKTAVKKEEKEKKKKKKRKEAPFPIPEWATELQSLIQQIQSMEGLVADA